MTRTKLNIDSLIGGEDRVTGRDGRSISSHSASSEEEDGDLPKGKTNGRPLQTSSIDEDHIAEDPHHIGDPQGLEAIDYEQLLHKKKIYCKKVVAGNISYLQGDFSVNYYYMWIKIISITGFIVAVVLSTHFKLSLGMWVILMAYLRFFWSSHSFFWDTATDQKLEAKISARLTKFYMTFLSKRGLLKEESVREEKE